MSACKFSDAQVQECENLLKDATFHGKSLQCLREAATSPPVAPEKAEQALIMSYAQKPPARLRQPAWVRSVCVGRQHFHDSVWEFQHSDDGPQFFKFAFACQSPSFICFTVLEPVPNSSGSLECGDVDEQASAAWVHSFIVQSPPKPEASKGKGKSRKQGSKQSECPEPSATRHRPKPKAVKPEGKAVYWGGGKKAFETEAGHVLKWKKTKRGKAENRSVRSKRDRVIKGTLCRALGTELGEAESKVTVLRRKLTERLPTAKSKAGGSDLLSWQAAKSKASGSSSSTTTTPWQQPADLSAWQAKQNKGESPFDQFDYSLPE